MSDIIDGKEIAAQVEREVKEQVATLARDPQLAAVLMSDDEASEIYVRKKKEACERLGIESRIVELDPEKTEDELIAVIDALNNDSEINGILVQLPLPDHIDSNRVFKTITPAKDVDGLTPENMGLVMQNNPRLLPATPRAISRILQEKEINVPGKHVVIVNNSNILGKPLAAMLMQEGTAQRNGNATVTVCHEYTEDLKHHTRSADILVTGIGKPEYITADMVKEEATVIDAGISRVENDGKTEIVGDADFEAVREKASAITPVPGGVGPVTVATVIKNTVEAAAIQESNES